MTQRAASYRAIDAEMDRVFNRYDSGEVADVPFKGKYVCGRVDDFGTVTNHPQVRHRRTIVNANYANGITFRTPGNPILTSDLEREIDYTMAGLGENTFEVLDEVADQGTLHQLFDPALKKAAEAQKVIYSKSKQGGCIMARLIENGKMEEVVFARFESGEDTLKTLYDICREKDVRTDVILDGSGNAADLTYQHFPINPKLCPTNISIGAMHGKCKTSLQDIIGTTMCSLTGGSTPDTVAERTFPTIPGSWERPMDRWPMVDCKYGPRTPYIHAHCVTSNADYTVCGYLIPDTRVTSGDPSKPSHFAVIIAKISGVELQATTDHKIGFYQNLVWVDE